ncbi:MAG TPA: histidine--tRNA ligase [Aequorivita sp.]|nr:histidine--tRNA ligase [Aequorivita sp.]
MSKKPSIPKGTRDFNPEEVSRRNYIFNTIKETFSLYGFQPIETPSFENSETLMGKYGEEGDRLIFKILNSGDYLQKFNLSIVESIKDSLFNLHNAIVNFPKGLEIDWGTYEERYLSTYPKLLKEKKEIQFSDEKISFKKLAKDIWSIIKTNIIKSGIIDKEESLKEFLLNGQERLNDYTLRLFADFYFQLGNNYINNQISEKALRYDLTVPFARYVVQHQNEITFPFKRYQIQPVWRADRPQKGRFREFFQCDADVVGSTSLWQEVEFVQLYDAVFSKLNLKGVTIKINNRKILSGIAETIGAEDKLIDFTVALDKLDKIGEEGVKKEMREKGISEDALQKLQPLFSLNGTASEQLKKLKALLSNSKTGIQGVEELEFITDNIETLGLQTASLHIDVTLARGLNYYTGAIFEVSAPKEVNMGSIGGGGRYDDLTGIFGLKDMSGVGISFGLDRIYLVLEELNLFPETVSENSKALFINFGEKEALYAMKAISKLRIAGIKAELYPDATKMGKQMGYADKRNIAFAILAGEKEMEAQSFTLKNMKSGEQTQMDFSELETFLKI